MNIYDYLIYIFFNIKGYLIDQVFILPRVAELLNHKEKQRGCLLLDANKHTPIYYMGICLFASPRGQPHCFSL